MGDSSTERPHTIVLAIDGLRPSALGAYGATAHATPTLDRFAAESTLFEWAYADTPDPAAIYERLAPSDADQAGRRLLVTDDVALPVEAFRRGFTDRVTPDVDKPEAVADSIAETTQAAVWARLAEALAEAASATSSEERVFAWLHTRGLYGPWDAPPSSYEALVDEDDPPVDPTAHPAAAWFDDAGSPEACEARFAAACRYAGQVAVLDACVEGFLDVVQGLFEGQTTRIVLVGLRGYPLGEHGKIGGVDARLFSEQQHVPLLVRSSDPSDRFRRLPGLTGLSDALRSSLRGTAPSSSESITLASAEARAVLTAERMARAPIGGAAAELYVKPDDRWEQNDIASLEEQTTDALLAGHAIDAASEDSA